MGARAGGNDGGGPRLTMEYAFGVLAGVGLGLMIATFLIRRFDADPSTFTWPGMMIAVAGGVAAHMARKRAAR